MTRRTAARAMMMAIAAALGSASAGCTFGLDTETYVLRADLVEDGIAELEVADFALEGALAVRGRADRFTAQVQVTAWLRPGEDIDVAAAASVGFARAGDVLVPSASIDPRQAEFLTVRDVEFGVPPGVAVDVHDVDTSLTVSGVGGQVRADVEDSIDIRDVTGDVTARSSLGEVTVADVDGAVEAFAATVTVSDTGPVVIEADDAVTARIGQGGEIRLRPRGTGTITVTVTGDAFDELILDAGSGSVDVTLPRGGAGWLLDVAGGLPADPEAEEEAPDRVSIQVGGTAVSDAELEGVFQIGGGGPRIVVRGVGISIHE